MPSDSYALTVEEGVEFFERNGDDAHAGVLEHLARGAPLDVSIEVMTYQNGLEPGYHFFAVETGERDGRYGTGSAFKPRGELTADGATYLKELTGDEITGFPELEAV